MSKPSLALLGVAAVVTACGGMERSPGVVDAGSARTAVDEIRALSTSMTAMDARGVLVHVQALTRANQLIVTRTGDGAGLRGPIGSAAVLEPKEGTASCDPASCTFDRYGIGVPYTAFSLSGTITRSGDTLGLALTYRYVDKRGAFDWELEGSVTPTATALDGTFRSLGTADPDSAFFQGDLTWETTVAYDAISLDPQGCPIGGAVHAVNIYEDPTGGPETQTSPSFDVEGTVTFGPACGDAR